MPSHLHRSAATKLGARLPKLAASILAAALLGAPAVAQNVNFAARADYDMSQPHPVQSATADFDLDGNLDIVVTCEGQGGGRVSVMWGDGNSDFGSSTDVTAYLAWGLCVDDFNGDGWPDIAVTSNGWAQHGVGILLNNHQRGFASGGSTSALGSPPVALASGDFDHDGDIDLAVASSSGGYSVDWFRNNGNGSFGSFNYVPYTNGLVGARLVAGDFDNDSWIDLALAHSTGVMVLMNVHQSYEQFHSSTLPAPTGSTSALVAVDMNNDGDLDLVAAGATVTCWYGQGDGGFASNSSSGIGPAYDVRVADVNGDGDLDVVAAAGSILIGYGYAGALSGVVQSVPTGLGPTTCVTGDWNNDGRIDLAAACNNSGNDAYLSIHDQAPAPPPTTYCTAKWSSFGCVPSIAFSGAPHATGATQFHITASAILNQKSGLLIYGFHRGTAPFQGGILCISGGTKRTPIQNSGGTSGATNCSGVFNYDMQARIQSGIDPMLNVGRTVDAQYWYRDPQDPFTSGLSNAVEFTIQG